MKSSPVQEKSPQQIQRETALKSANELRLQQSAIKRSLFQARSVRDALGQLAALVHENHPTIQRMLFSTLLDSCYRVGPRKVRQILNLTGISATCRVCDLTPRQRYRIAVVLNDRNL